MITVVICWHPLTLDSKIFFLQKFNTIAKCRVGNGNVNQVYIFVLKIIFSEKVRRISAYELYFRNILISQSAQENFE